MSAEQNTIAAPEGVEGVGAIVPHPEVLQLPGGDVGIVAGRTAAALWKRTLEFLGLGGEQVGT